MRNQIRLLLFFVIAASVFSGATCAGSRQPSQAPTEVTSKDGGVEYPPVPADIMQAEVKSLDGPSFKLSDKKGKVVLVNLWATWCGPCIKEMPELVALHEEFKGSGFEVMGLNVDDEPVELIKPFAEEQGLTYPLGWTADGQLNDFTKLSRRAGIPQSFLIDRAGRLRGTFFSASDAEIAKLKETTRSVVKE